jgi:hypothetical protein
MKFDEAVTLAEGNLLNEEILNEILYNKYVNTLLTKNEYEIKNQNRRIIEAEGKPNKMRSFPHGEITANKNVTMPDCGGFDAFAKGVMDYLQKTRTEEDIKKLIPYINIALQDLKKRISEVKPIEDEKTIKK